MHRTTPFIALLIAAPLVAQTAAPAKPAHLQGQVVDTLGHPIRAAIVETDDPPKATVADDDGFFKFADLPPGPITIRVRRLGYTGIDFQLRLLADSTVSISVRLFTAAQTLAPVEVDAGAEGRHPQLAQTGFYRRMRVGWGHMVTPEEIDKKRSTAPTASFFLQDIVGVSVKHAPVRGRGGAGGAMVYGKSPNGSDCIMNLVMNGTPVKLGPNETFDNYFNPTELYAIETYARATEIPAEYQSLLGNYCGAIVVWTVSKMTLKP
jgi:hypothetical protein